MRKIKTVITMTIVAVLCAPLAAWADQQVGAVVGLKGKALVQRSGSSREARLKDQVELRDMVETAKQSRAKLLFIDESILTLGPESKASIEKFVYGKEGGGASIFNLLDGKMRSIVGKNAFEVHTPTSVAAARGTIIDFLVGTKGGKPFTSITCLRGAVEVRSLDPSITDIVNLAAGQTITVFQGEALREPTRAPASGPRAAAKGTGEDKDGDGAEAEEETGEAADESGTAFDEMAGDLSVGVVSTETAILPPIELESETGKTTPVKIDVKFPQ